MEAERADQLRAAHQSGDSTDYKEWLAMWKLRAAMAKQYSVSLTPEQHEEQNAWAKIQRRALAAILDHKG
jgi:hypothetical protein